MSESAKTASFRPGPGLLAGLGGVIFAAASIINAPASLAAAALSSQSGNIQYQALSGTLWNGEMKGVSAAGIALGDVAFRANPLALLTGAVDAKFDVKGGAVLARGEARYNLFSGRATLRDAKGEFNLAAVRNYTLFGIPYRGALRADVERLDWTKNGCAMVSGDVWTDVLDTASRQYFGDGLALAGPAACKDGSLDLDLNGANKEGAATVKVVVAPDFTYKLTASAEPARSELQDNLRRLGFEDNNGAFVYDAIGALKGAGS